jgi:peptidoglycan hydrolase FlgJ
MDFATPDLRDAMASARRPPQLARGADPAQTAKAAQDFEAFFLSQVFEDMFAGIEPDSMFGGGQGETVFRSLLIQEYGRAVARNGGVGIADAVQNEILKLQEVQP